MHCDECGKEIANSSEFCGYCGTRVGGEVAARASAAGPLPPPPGPAAYTPPPAFPEAPAAPPMQPGPGFQPRRKSPLPWMLGALGGVVVVVALLLVFVLFKGDDRNNSSNDISGPESAGGYSSPEEAVKGFCKAVEKQDVEMLLDAWEPSFREELEDALGENLERFFKDFFFAFSPQGLKFKIRKMETEIDGDEAVVAVVDGTISYTDENGERVTKEASEADIEPLRLIRVGGRWYISGGFLKGLGIDPDDLGDLDPDELIRWWDGGADYGGEGETAEVEAAMLAYAGEYSAEGLEFEIHGLLIKGDEACGAAVCTNQDLDAPWVVMRRGAGGWYGVDIRSGDDPPFWYPWY